MIVSSGLVAKSEKCHTKAEIDIKTKEVVQSCFGDNLVWGPSERHILASKQSLITPKNTKMPNKDKI